MGEAKAPQPAYEVIERADPASRESLESLQPLDPLATANDQSHITDDDLKQVIKRFAALSHLANRPKCGGPSRSKRAGPPQ